MSKEAIICKESKTLDFINLIKKYGISFDIDGVEAQSSYPAVKYYNEKFGIKYGAVCSVYQLKSFWSVRDMLMGIKVKFPDSLNDPYAEAVEIWNNNEVLGGCNLEQGSYALASFLAIHGVIPYRITSRPSYVSQSTYDWYKEKYPWVPKDKIIIQAGNLPDGNFKKQKILDLEIKFHLDDSFEHAEKIASEGVWVGLVEQPWNKNYLPTNPLIVKPCGYLGRPEIIRTFLSLKDKVLANQ